MDEKVKTLTSGTTISKKRDTMLQELVENIISKVIEYADKNNVGMN